jgi:hypothetical protein
MGFMAEKDDYMRHVLDPDFDHPPALSPQAVPEEPLRIETLIEGAARRQLPPGHIAFAGQATLDQFRPKL